jgi:hypothetical protein
MALIASGKQKVPHPIFTHLQNRPPQNPAIQLRECYHLAPYANYAIKRPAKLRE